jgi:hypothetical protein
MWQPAGGSGRRVARARRQQRGKQGQDWGGATREEGEAGGGAATVAERRLGGELCAGSRRGTKQRTCSGKKKKRGEGVRRTCLEFSRISETSGKERFPTDLGV